MSAVTLRSHDGTRIVAETVGFDPALPYNGRVRAVKAAGIAVWDVLQSCTREGSLDSGIDRNSLKVNDFGSFFRTHPACLRLRHAEFNLLAGGVCDSPGRL